MEDFVHDLPLSVDFQQREQVSEPVPRPVFEFEPHGSNGINKVDARDVCTKLRRRTLLAAD